MSVPDAPWRTRLRDRDRSLRTSVADAPEAIETLERRLVGAAAQVHTLTEEVKRRDQVICDQMLTIERQQVLIGEQQVVMAQLRNPALLPGRLVRALWNRARRLGARRS